MARSKNFYKVYNYYRNGLWTLEQVRKAVEKKWITAEEFKTITGEDY